MPLDTRSLLLDSAGFYRNHAENEDRDRNRSERKILKRGRFDTHAPRARDRADTQPASLLDKGFRVMDNSNGLAEWVFSFRAAGRQVRSTVSGEARD